MELYLNKLEFNAYHHECFVVLGEILKKMKMHKVYARQKKKDEHTQTNRCRTKLDQKSLLKSLAPMSKIEIKTCDKLSSDLNVPT